MSKEPKLTAKQKLFCNEYIVDMNATQAAIRAGYSMKTARQMGAENLSKPVISDYISKILNEKLLKADEVKKLISDIARGNLSDYFRPVKYRSSEKIKVGLQEVIDDIKAFIRREEIFCERMGFTEKEYDKFQEGLNSERQRVIRYEIELEENPEAYRIIDGPTELVERYELDINALVADKEKGKIKTFKISAEGAITVELYSAADAQEKLAKLHGLYEKDNDQKAAKIDFGKLPDDVLNALINASK